MRALLAHAKRTATFGITFTFMRLPDAFIRNDLHCIQSTHSVDSTHSSQAKITQSAQIEISFMCATQTVWDELHLKS